jgi:hypothetical protein
MRHRAASDEQTARASLATRLRSGTHIRERHWQLSVAKPLLTRPASAIREATTGTLTIEKWRSTTVSWSAGGRTQPESTDVRSGRLAACDLRPSPPSPGKWRFSPLEKRHLAPVSAPNLTIFSGFFCGLAQEVAKCALNAFQRPRFAGAATQQNLSRRGVGDGDRSCDTRTFSRFPARLEEARRGMELLDLPLAFKPAVVHHGHVGVVQGHFQKPRGMAAGPVAE